MWDPTPDTMDKTIGLYRDADLNNRSEWGHYADWMVGTIARFRKVFGRRVRFLDLNQPTQTFDED
jgi:hypothetical protein